MLKVYTSHFRYSGDDRLDVTVKSGDKTFAPTWELVSKYKSGLIDDDQYFARYKKLMNISFKRNKFKWKELLSKDRVTLVCYCSHEGFCHRKILANLFAKLGAEYVGEIDSRGVLIKA